MTISSRTPEGLPSECPLCGAATNIEYSNQGRDAPCPACGYLLQKSQALLERLGAKYAKRTGTSASPLSASAQIQEVAGSSLETAELLMELEDELHISIPDEVAERIGTAGDLVRYLQDQLGDHKA
jgi:acyl carrier protein